MSLLHYVAALLAGAATVLAFAPTGVYPVALVSLALLAHLWMRAAPRACFLTGACFGMGFFGAGVSWIYVSLSQFGGMPPLLAALATLLFCALLAFFPASAGWLQARVPGPEFARALLLIPASWTLFEWLRGWIFSGFPWLSAGYAATGWPLQGFAPLLGVADNDARGGAGTVFGGGDGIVKCSAIGDGTGAADTGNRQIRPTLHGHRH